ncbi:MAG: iron-sulfur cluster repair di-iron protein [Clostridiales bacterium]|nr:iron-sulfur cluster repair di-iron protein [Clostridiales bacterium]
MSKFNSQQNIGDIVAEFPKAGEVFKEYKIDFCCGGNRPLSDAIEKQNLNETEVLDKVNKLYETFANTMDTNWREANLDEFVDHIVNKHHGYLWKEMPEIGQLTTLILKVHGLHHPELSKVHKLFHTVKMDLEGHLTKEETLQYPAIRKFIESKSKEDLDEAVRIIKELEDEHTEAGNILKDLRAVTNDYEIPEDVCGTFVNTYQKLQEMESDLFEHIHLENNILFPRLFALQESMSYKTSN